MRPESQVCVYNTELLRRSELLKAQAALSKYHVVSNQVRYSLVDRSVEVQLLRSCAENQITVIAYSPLASRVNHIKEGDPHAC
jgi:aryl-alcohol dehydrogenase-like predicted oxidoreductase